MVEADLLLHEVSAASRVLLLDLVITKHPILVLTIPVKMLTIVFVITSIEPERFLSLSVLQRVMDIGVKLLFYFDKRHDVSVDGTLAIEALEARLVVQDGSPAKKLMAFFDCWRCIPETVGVVGALEETCVIDFLCGLNKEERSHLFF